MVKKQKVKLKQFAVSLEPGIAKIVQEQADLYTAGSAREMIKRFVIVGIREYPKHFQRILDRRGKEVDN